MVLIGAASVRLWIMHIFSESMSVCLSACRPSRNYSKVTDRFKRPKIMYSRKYSIYP